MNSSDIFYTQFAGSYSQYSAIRQAYLSAVNNFIKREAGSIKTIVDVGSGDGKRSSMISDLLDNKSLTLIDSSIGMINLARNIPDALIVKGDISSTEFKLENKYDIALCLWNVLGHIEFDNRKVALKNLASLIYNQGIIFLDVNNRYNISHYGIKNVLKNICRDMFVPRKSNGDFELNIDTNKGKINTTVHIFNPYEIERLFKSAGLIILKREIISYDTGEIKDNFWNGQLVYKLTKI